MCLGAKDNSFLVRENIIDVLGNNLTDLQVRHHDTYAVNSKSLSPSDG